MCLVPNSPDYNVEFFRKFVLVMNALDNRGILKRDFKKATYRNDNNNTLFFLIPIAARNHVNRMCLAADIPLIESGTAGYLGQVTVIKKVATCS